MKRGTVTFVLVCLSLGIAVSAYQALFCMWMSAHPVYRSPDWARLFYIRLFTTVIILGCWIATLLKLRAIDRDEGSQSRDRPRGDPTRNKP
jgi:hypothetical protein